MQKITVFVVAESGSAKKGREAPLAPQVKSAPHYFAKSVPEQEIVAQEKLKIKGLPALPTGQAGGRQGVSGKIIVKTYHPYAVLATADVDVGDVFSEDILELKDKVMEACYEAVEKQGGKREFSEEYTVYQVSDYHGDPEVFLERFAPKMAALLKSEKLELDEKEVEHTLSFQFKYAKDELMVLDWDGAFLFDPTGEFGQALELLELANYQLLRYRILDRSLDDNLKLAYRLIQHESHKWFRIKKVNEAFKEVIRIRSHSIAHFDAVERDVKLIGDWYSARVFDLLSKKFRLQTWRANIKEKLESLEDIYSIVSENLGVSRMQTLESIQTAGWFILQIGWFVLIILEFMYFTKK